MGLLSVDFYKEPLRMIRTCFIQKQRKLKNYQSIFLPTASFIWAKVHRI